MGKIQMRMMMKKYMMKIIKELEKISKRIELIMTTILKMERLFMMKIIIK